MKDNSYQNNFLRFKFLLLCGVQIIDFVFFGGDKVIDIREGKWYGGDDMRFSREQVQQLQEIVIQAVDQTVDAKFKVASERTERFEKSVDAKFKVTTERIDKFEQSMDDKFRYNNDLLRQDMKAMEHRLESKMERLKNDILAGVAAVISDGINPQLDDHNKRLTKLELGMVAI